MFKSDRRKKREVVAQERTVSPPVSPELVTMFLNLQEKLNSPVFNGGFDKLFMKVENIETSQKQTAEALTTINRTIYEPDEGLFSRIKRVEGANSNEFQKLNGTQEELKTDFQELKEGLRADFDELKGGLKIDFDEMKATLKAGATLASDFAALKTRVEGLEEWRKDMSRKLWILIPVTITLLGKIGWDFIVSHVALK